MFRFVRLLALLLVAFCTLSPAAAALRLHDLFGDGMVLQRHAETTIWGWARAATTVTIDASWHDATIEVDVDPDGRWNSSLPPAGAGGPHTISLSDGLGNRIELNDVLIGEVWLCSGQSNMVWTVEQSDETERTLDEAEQLDVAESIRVFTVPFAASARPKRTFDVPPAGWRPATRETLLKTSAVAYHFARTLHVEESVPVGIIVSAVGGTAIEPWMPSAALAPLAAPQTLQVLRALDAGQQEGAPTIDQRTPTALYNAMIAPLTGMTLGGICWYQGESNAREPQVYAERLAALIRSWRDGRFGGVVEPRAQDLPVLVVQLAPFNWGPDRGHWALLREAQSSVLELPNTGVVVTLDVGDPKDIHPGDKRTVGERLGRLAQAVALGRDVSAHSPRMLSHAREGDAIRVRFADAGGAIRHRGDRRGQQEIIEGVTIAGEDRRFIVARVELDGDSILVRSPLVPDPVAVRYAWSAAPVATLVGEHGLPVAPFRTDDWPMPEDGWLPPDDEGHTPWLMPADIAADAGFESLFNGQDLDGWANINCAPGTFEARTNDLGQSVIYCTGKPICVLRTDRMYRNFILELEFRHLIPGGNAGLFVWSDGMTAPGQPFTRSVEVQVLDGREGDWFTSDGDIFPIHGATMVPVNGRGGDRAFPTERRIRTAPLWNHYRVICMEGEITLSVNGKVVTRGGESSPRKGYICLESEGSPIEFRNLRVRELRDRGPLPPELIADASEGFEPLYTGVDLSGWRTESPDNWHVRDWVLAYDGGGADLWTDEQFEDFELIVDWRLPREPRPARWPVIGADGRQTLDVDGTPITEEVADAGDSGIFLRGSTTAQVNIWCWPIGSGEVWGYRIDESMPDAVRSAVTPRTRADRPPGQWNRFRIRMVGQRLTVDLNGVRVIENAELPGVPARGAIGLQHHGDAVEFANVMIRRLTSD